VLHHPQREEVLPHVQTELPMLQFVPIAPCPVAGHHWKEFGPIFLTPTPKIFISIYKVQRVQRVTRIQSKQVPLANETAVRSGKCRLAVYKIHSELGLGNGRGLGKTRQTCWALRQRGWAGEMRVKTQWTAWRDELQWKECEGNKNNLHIKVWTWGFWFYVYKIISFLTGL